MNVSDNDDEDSWDVSSIFWSFVHDMNRMDYDDLVLTHGFAAMSDASNSGQAIYLDEAMLAAARTVPPDVIQELGSVTFDTSRKCYMFGNSNSLFLGALRILRGSDPATEDQRALYSRRAEALGKCIERMQSTLSVIGASDKLDCLDLDDHVDADQHST